MEHFHVMDERLPTLLNCRLKLAPEENILFKGPIKEISKKKHLDHVVLPDELLW